MGFIKIDNGKTNEPVKLYYQDIGQGQPVVLIHGWPLNHAMWEYQVNDLVDAGFRVIAYDRRGFGMSSRPYDGYDYDTLTDDLHELLEQLNLEDVTLVGFSMGGGEVARYFTRWGGKRISKAVLIGSITPYMLKTEDHPKGVDASVFQGMADQIEEDRIAFLDDFGKQFFGVSIINKPVSAPLLEYYRMQGSLASPRATQECAKAFAFTDFRKDVASIYVPTLIIHGTDDKTVPIEGTAEEAAKLIPDNQFIRYEGAPHGLFYTERKRLNKDLISFIKTPVAVAYS